MSPNAAVWRMEMVRRCGPPALTVKVRVAGSKMP
jgi:hypothetical protein